MFQYLTTVAKCSHKRDSAVVHYAHFEDPWYHCLVLYQLITCNLSLENQSWAQYLTGHAIKLNTVEMRSLRSWTEIDSTRQSLLRIPFKIKSAHGVQWADVWKRMLPELSKCKGNFSPQIQLPDSHFGQFRAIGPMGFLRPANLTST